MATSTGWFFGDSFIQGYLCHPGDPYYENSKEKDKRIASKIVCDSLKVNHKNLAYYGFNNESILHTIFTNIDKIKEDDYVFIMDSHAVRTPIVYNNENYYNNWPKGSYMQIDKSTHTDNLYAVRMKLQKNLNEFYKTIFEGVIKEFKLRKINAFYINTANTFLAEHNIHKILHDIPKFKDNHWSFKGHQQAASMFLSKIKRDII